VPNPTFKLWIAQRARKEASKLERLDRIRLRLGTKICLGPERWEGWTGDISVYLFRCPGCGDPTIDYPHGYIQYRYLTCYRCGTRINFVPWWFFWAELGESIKIAWRYRK